jgi:streptogramin lyase
MRVLAAPALLVALAASSSAAGTSGIAAKLAASPVDLAAQTTWTAHVRITSGGRPLRHAKAVLVANGLGRVKRFPLRETRSRGVYTARTVLPAAGRWTLSVRLGKRVLRLAAVAVGPRRPDVKGPFGLAVGPDGHVAIADRDSDRVLIVNPRTGASRVAATGLDDPIAVAYDSSGSLYANSGERVLRIGTGGNTVVAGTGTRGHSGDGGPATAANLGGLGSFAFGPGNELFLPEYDNWIRRVRADGIIETIAGTGSEGFAGDGGPAKAAAIAAPHGLAVRSDGSVVFADSHNGRVRRIDPSGTMSTLASGFVAPVSIAAAPDGSVVVGDAQTGLLQRIEPNGAVTVVASKVRLPSGIAVDLHGDIYFSEFDAGRVRVYDLETNRITTVAR